MDLSRRLFRVEKTSAPQLRCIFSWWIDFWTIWQHPGTLCIDFDGLKSAKTPRDAYFLWKYQLSEPGNIIIPRPDPRASRCSSGHPFQSSLTLTSPNRCTECPDASKTTGNQLPMKKYVGAVVRKSSQLVIDEEIDHSENQISFHKKTYNLDPQKKKRNYIDAC